MTKTKTAPYKIEYEGNGNYSYAVTFVTKDGDHDIEAYYSPYKTDLLTDKELFDKAIAHAAYNNDTYNNNSYVAKIKSPFK
tara:strand:- start:2563 stop:2805 length:243 start_codon:yes stop_codon:yes gene_type:complete